MFRGLVVVEEQEVLGAGAVLRRVLCSRQFLQVTVVICSDLEEVVRKTSMLQAKPVFWVQAESARLAR